jgi:hypothetical protein
MKEEFHEAFSSSFPSPQPASAVSKKERLGTFRHLRRSRRTARWRAEAAAGHLATQEKEESSGRPLIFDAHLHYPAESGEPWQ